MACKLSIQRYNFLKIFNLHKYLPNAKKLRNNLTTQYPSFNIPWNYAKNHRSFFGLIPLFIYKVNTKILKFFSWRNFIQNCFDKIFYIDEGKDMFGDEIKNKLDKIYYKKNKKLLKYVPKNKIPIIYLN